jgi:hypothetical protein
LALVKFFCFERGFFHAGCSGLILGRSHVRASVTSPAKRRIDVLPFPAPCLDIGQLSSSLNDYC